LRRLAETRPNTEIDFLHFIEEVEDLGSERLFSVLSQTERLIEHLLKLEYSPSADPRPGWLRTVDSARREIARRLTSAIRRHLEGELADLYAHAAKDAARELRHHHEREAAAALPATCPYPLDRLLDEDWYPVSRHGLVDE
jgi:hypothetical protein